MIDRGYEQSVHNPGCQFVYKLGLYVFEYLFKYYCIVVFGVARRV